MDTSDTNQVAKLDKGQRIGVGLLIVISIALIGVSIVQFRANIFEYGRRVKIDNLAAVDPATRAKNELEALKKTDTDTDGLSDYDELTVYHSSPYMRDTDSDNAPDGEEVRRGTSPTCPEGKDCMVNTVAADAQAAEQQSAPKSSAAGSTSAPAPAATASATQAQQTMTIVQIREALIANGVPKEQIDAMTDAELLKLVEEAQKDDGETQASPPAPPGQ